MLGLILLWRGNIFGFLFDTKTLECHEADIPSSEQEALAKARLSGADEDQIRSQADRPAAAEGPQTARRYDSQEIGTRKGKGRHRFPRDARIRRGAEIRQLLRKGERKRTDHLEAFVTGSPSSRTRLALIVPKYGHKIVERNRLKRRLREAVRLSLLPACRETGSALDIAIRTRPNAYSLGYSELEREIGELTEVLCSPRS